MTPFDQLRHMAVDRRDKQYKQARTEYDQACKTIDDLERHFYDLVRKTNKRRSVYSFIVEAMTPGEPITLIELTKRLAGKYPTRKPHRDALRKTIYRLRSKGLIQKVGTDEKGSPVLVISGQMS